MEVTKKHKLTDKIDEIYPKSEPGLLLRDTKPGQMALHAQNLLVKMFQPEANKKVKAEMILLALVYLEAMEMGFISPQEYKNIRSELEDVPFIGPFHAKNVQRLSLLVPSIKYQSECCVYSLQICSLSENHDINETIPPTRISAAINEGAMILTAIPPDIYSKAGFSTCINIERFILDNSKLNLFERIINLQDFSVQLCDDIFVPLRNLYMRSMDVCVYANLGSLPEMVGATLLRYLPLADIGRLAQVNRRLNATVKWAFGKKFGKPSPFNFLNIGRPGF